MTPITKNQALICVLAIMATFSAYKGITEGSAAAAVQGATSGAIGGLVMTIISKKLGMIED